MMSSEGEKGQERYMEETKILIIFAPFLRSKYQLWRGASNSHTPTLRYSETQVFPSQLFGITS